MSKIYLTKGILVGFCLALITLIWLAVYGYRTTRQFVSSSQGVVQIQDVLFHTEQVLTLATSLEAGQQGFCLTGNEEFLESYTKANNEINGLYQSLVDFSFDSKVQQDRLKELRINLDKLLMFSSSAVEMREKDFSNAQRTNAGLQGKHALDNIRRIIDDFQSEEKRLLKQRKSENEFHVASFKAGMIGLLLLTFLVLIFMVITSNNNLKKCAESEARVRKVSEEVMDLYDNAPCGYHSLNDQGVFVDVNATMLRWLGYSREEVVGNIKFRDLITADDEKTFVSNYPVLKDQGYVHDLEFTLKKKDGTLLPVILSSTAIYGENGEFVKSRSSTFDNTFRIKAEKRIRELNQELEAFTYSVSHDLRAPLRSIDGYARILKEDYEQKLDDEGKRVISVIMGNAKRMAQLIDDLLEFSRLGRKEITKANTDMTRLVQNAIEELMQSENGRKIDVKINNLLPATVDVNMIRQVWVNLLSNALKYSGKKTETVIEVNSEELPGEICYRVKDNGVGFDMQYKSKLFSVFQRLHKIQDFPGTGVGLAIVKRIIDRHQGRVWAEAKLNEGASFYFTIPKLNAEQ